MRARRSPTVPGGMWPEVRAAATRCAPTGQRFSGGKSGRGWLATSASAVLIGRPFAYALASDGEAGVRHLIRTLIADVDLTLALSGRTSVDEVDRSLLERD